MAEGSAAIAGRDGSDAYARRATLEGAQHRADSRYMTLLDVSIVNVALSSIRQALHAPDAALQWIVSGYALSFGLVPVAAERLGDARGRRTMFVVGVGVFTVASLAAGLSPNARWFVGARLLQGVGGGTINPQVSGLVQQLVRRGAGVGVRSAGHHDRDLHGGRPGDRRRDPRCRRQVASLTGRAAHL